MASITLQCLSCTRLKGKTKPTEGREARDYDIYTGFYKDTLSDRVGKFVTNVIDGSMPPIPGETYPVEFDVYTTRDDKFLFRPKLSPEYVR